MALLQHRAAEGRPEAGSGDEPAYCLYHHQARLREIAPAIDHGARRVLGAPAVAEPGTSGGAAVPDSAQEKCLCLGDLTGGRGLYRDTGQAERILRRTL